MWMKGQTPQKKHLKNTHTTRERGQIQPEKGITLIPFFIILIILFFSFQHVNTNRVDTCQNAGLPTLWAE